jgi:hypothetical protein
MPKHETMHAAIEAIEGETHHDRSNQQTQAAGGVLLLVSEGHQTIRDRITIVDRSDGIDRRKVAQSSSFQGSVFPDHGRDERGQSQLVDQIDLLQRTGHVSTVPSTSRQFLGEAQSGQRTRISQTFHGDLVVGQAVNIAVVTDHEKAIELREERAIVTDGDHRAFETVQGAFECFR